MCRPGSTTVRWHGWSCRVPRRRERDLEQPGDRRHWPERGGTAPPMPRRRGRPGCHDRLRRFELDRRQQGCWPADGTSTWSNSTCRRRFRRRRARNAGFQRLLQIDPDVCFVQFLDGDCEVADGWLDRARRTLEERTGAAVVFGRIRERFPERSIYNRLADIEWNVLDEGGLEEGPAQTCGGIAMMRVEAFRRRRRIRRLRPGGRGARTLPAAPSRGMVDRSARCRHDLARLGHVPIRPVGTATGPHRLRWARFRDPLRAARRPSVRETTPQCPILDAGLAVGRHRRRPARGDARWPDRGRVGRRA